MHRPAGVSFAALVAAGHGFWILLVSGVFVLFSASFQSVFGVVVAVLSILYGLFELFLAGALFRLTSWARFVGVAVFTLAALWHGVRMFGDLSALLTCGLNTTCAVLLFINGDAFGTSTDRADLSDEHATSIGSGL
ncbi:hypothetical protein [Haloarchaeobius amylolyticus]|uniref:hypothetical protein n=1 Tax=Haloarchaeobius amylolyticus TaxID=1198296 RepID=UPI00226DA2FB|nr:hypothetical protein [Haloarchaeobius amylolyticus]